jgi:hypothetical protein
MNTGVAAHQPVDTSASFSPGLIRWALGIGISIAVFAVVSFFNGNDVKDYLSQQGLQVASVEVAAQYFTIRVDVGNSDGNLARRVCEALRGVYTREGDGAELSPRVQYDGGSYSGSFAQSCSRSDY